MFRFILGILPTFNKTVKFGQAIIFTALNIRASLKIVHVRKRQFFFRFR